jgi:hypothetical protein
MGDILDFEHTPMHTYELDSYLQVLLFVVGKVQALLVYVQSRAYVPVERLRGLCFRRSARVDCYKASD